MRKKRTGKKKKFRRRSASTRIYDKKYRSWIKKVFARDGFKCVMCDSKKQIQAHHIVRHSDSVKGRLLVKNGACLCKTCHLKVNDKEREYAPLLRKLVKKRSETKTKTRDSGKGGE